MNPDGENYVLEIEEQLADKRRMSLFRIIISSFIRNRTALLGIVIICLLYTSDAADDLSV